MSDLPWITKKWREKEKEDSEGKKRKAGEYKYAKGFILIFLIVLGQKPCVSADTSRLLTASSPNARSARYSEARMAPRSKKSRLSADAPADFFGHRKRWVVASNMEEALRHRRFYII